MRVTVCIGCLLVLGLAGRPAALRADEPKAETKQQEAKKEEPKKEEPNKEEKPASLADQVRELQKEYQKAQREFSAEYSKATTDEERQKAIKEKYPNPNTFAPRFLKLAEQDAKDPAALEALLWIVSYSGYGEEGTKAIDLLLEHHANSDKIGEICQRLVYSPSPAAEKLLRKVASDSSNHDAKGKATLSLARYLKQRSADAKEIETLLEAVEKDFADVKGYRGTLADLAKGDLFEIRFLAIGKDVPEIEGQDIDSAAFKLSDYRGKVVVLDFWGNW